MSSDWQPLTELPDLRRVSAFSRLIPKTRDDGLRADRGSAWPWRGGHVAGVSVAYRADAGIRSHYFPIRHPETANFEPEQVFRWLKDLVASDVRFVTQNGLYDWGWLRADGDVRMPPSDRLEEIGAMATLIDENRLKYSLASLCAWRGLPGKDLSELERAVTAAGFAPKRKEQTDQRGGTCLAAAGALRRRLRRGRCGQHLSVMGRSRSGPRSRRNARRLPA